MLNTSCQRQRRRHYGNYQNGRPLKDKQNTEDQCKEHPLEQLLERFHCHRSVLLTTHILSAASGVRVVAT